MDLYLIRHTMTRAERGVCYGRLDVSLAPTYAEDCAAVIERLPAPDAIWTSPLARCRVLAEAIGAHIGATPMIDERLCELDFGMWEGLHWDAIDQVHGKRWAADYWNVAPPRGETYRGLHKRISAVLEEITASDVQCVAVVTHAGPIRAAVAQCLRLDPRSYPALKLDYGGINLLRIGEDGAMVEYLNG